jgi:hypothetical protein
MALRQEVQFIPTIAVRIQQRLELLRKKWVA